MQPNAIYSYKDYARRFLAWRVGDYTPRGAIGSTRTPPSHPSSTADLAKEAREYASELRTAGLAGISVDTYVRHAMFFVRYLDGEFKPGRRLRRGYIELGAYTWEPPVSSTDFEESDAGRIQINELVTRLAAAAELQGECRRGPRDNGRLRPILKDEGLFWCCDHTAADGGPHCSNRVDP
jgi:hypothetical protein